MKSKYILLIFGVTILCGFFAVKTSYASVFVDSTFTPTTTISAGYDTNVTGIPQYATSTGTQYGGTFYQLIHVNSVSVGGGDFGMLGFLACTDQNGGTCVNADAYSLDGTNLLTNVADTGIVGALSDQDVILRFPSGTLTGFTNDFVLVGYFGTVNGVFPEVFWANTFSAINYLWGCSATSLTEAWECNNVIAPIPSISFVYPLNATSTSDFLNWKVRFNVATATNRLYQIQINYGQGTSTQPYVDIFPTALQGSQITAGYLDLTTILYKHIKLFNGENISAQAHIISVNADVCPNWTPCSITDTASDIINFTIDSAKQITIQTITSSTNPLIIQQAAQTVIDVTNPANPSNFFGDTGITATTTISSSSQIAASFCTPAADWTDIGGVSICRLCHNQLSFYPQFRRKKLCR